MKTILLSDQELNLIAQALGVLPYHQVATLIGNIQAQLANQQKKPTPPASGLPTLTDVIQEPITHD